MSCESKLYVQALPPGEETDFIMVGCAGVPVAVTDIAQHEKMLASKRRGTELCLSCMSLQAVMF